MVYLKSVENVITLGKLIGLLLPTRASEQGNVIGSVRIYNITKYSTLPRGISVYIVPKVGMFPEAGGRGKYSLPRVQYMPILHKEGF